MAGVRGLVNSDNTILAPQKRDNPKRCLVGYLAKVGGVMISSTGSNYNKLTLKMNYGYGVRTLNLNAFSDVNIVGLNQGDQVRLDVVESGEYFNLRKINRMTFADCFRCEHPVQDPQNDQVIYTLDISNTYFRYNYIYVYIVFQKKSLTDYLRIISLRSFARGVTRWSDEWYQQKGS